MLQDPVANRWVIPIIQGYCKIAHCINTFEEDDGDEEEDKTVVPFPPEEFDLVLVSRRSLNRAGENVRAYKSHRAIIYLGRHLSLRFEGENVNN